jgi:hypothetical protein
MTTDGPRQNNQRFSRFSRANFDDVLPPPPPEEPSLTDIAMRALNGHPEPSPRGQGPVDGWHQPPPPDPEPGTHWHEAGGAPRQQGRSAALNDQRTQATPGAPMQRADWNEPSPRQLRDAPPAPPRQERPPSYPIAEVAPAAEPASRRKGKPKPDTGPKQPGVFGRALTAARAKAGPALVNSAFWLARNLQRREIRKRYSRALVLTHGKIVDRKLEKLFFVSTTKSAAINPAPERGIHYDGPVPSAVFNWIMSAMPDDLRQFAFIDIRAGRGRSSLLASKWKFNRILAYEYDPQVFDDLQMNVAQFPRSLMACRRIDCHRGDVDGIALPVQPCIIYFSGAWRERMIPGVMDYVRDTYRQSPRPIYVVLENADDETSLAEDKIFERVEAPLMQRMKIKLFSPMEVRIYRSVI